MPIYNSGNAYGDDPTKLPGDPTQVNPGASQQPAASPPSTPTRITNTQAPPDYGQGQMTWNGPARPASQVGVQAGLSDQHQAALNGRPFFNGSVPTLSTGAQQPSTPGFSPDTRSLLQGIGSTGQPKTQPPISPRTAGPASPYGVAIPTLPAGPKWFDGTAGTVRGTLDPLPSAASLSAASVSPQPPLPAHRRFDSRMNPDLVAAQPSVTPGFTPPPTAPRTYLSPPDFPASPQAKPAQQSQAPISPRTAGPTPPPSLAQMARSSPNDPRTLQAVQAQLFHPGYDGLSNGVYAYKGVGADGVMQYSDRPFQGSSLQHMAGQGLTFAGDPHLLGGDTGGASGQSATPAAQAGGQSSAPQAAQAGGQGQGNAPQAAQAGGGQAPAPIPSGGGQGQSNSQAAAPTPAAAQASGGQAPTPTQPDAGQGSGQAWSSISPGGGQFGSTGGRPLDQGVLTPEQAQAYAQQLSAQRIASDNNYAQMTQDNALLRDQLDGHPAPGVYILDGGDADRVNQYNQFQQQAEQDYRMNRIGDPRARELLGARMARDQMQYGLDQQRMDVDMRGQNLNYAADMDRNSMGWRQYMMGRQLDIARFGMDQNHWNRQYELDTHKAQTADGQLSNDEAKTQLEGQKQAYDQQQSTMKRVQDQVASMVGAGPDGKPDTATAARYAAGLNNHVAKTMQVLQTIAQTPNDPRAAQAAQELTRYRQLSAGAMNPEDVRRLVSGMRLTDLVQGKGTRPWNPVGSTIVNSTDPIEWVQEHPTATGTEYWSNRGDRINARDLWDSNHQVPMDILGPLMVQSQGGN